MEEKLAEATNLDAVLSIHDDFLDTSLKEAMLTHPQLLKVRLLSGFERKKTGRAFRQSQ